MPKVTIKTKAGETKDATRRVKRALRKGKVDLKVEGKGVTTIDLTDTTGLPANVVIDRVVTGKGAVSIMKF
jgi:hypothetical protein